MTTAKIVRTRLIVCDLSDKHKDAVADGIWRLGTTCVGVVNGRVSLRWPLCRCPQQKTVVGIESSLTIQKRIFCRPYHRLFPNPRWRGVRSLALPLSASGRSLTAKRKPQNDIVVVLMGKYTNHKGRNRKFTSPEELEEQRKQEEQKQKWRKTHDVSSSEEESENSKSGSGGSSDESDSDDDHPTKAKGVSGLIEVENPNRVVKKNKKLTTLNNLGEEEKPQLSRREREEIERQRAAAAYQKAHAEGRTEQARADLARLAVIRQQREEAARRREAEKKAKEETTKKRYKHLVWNGGTLKK
ncbi:28 kDa heat- and acid-stable phosphoprotein [Eumeta japonica]|uniref:28 kDa heat-and acid-stable phosphoprotein n=1 Tax=Eumeta variegata TaxID=151549 RepID=A0A4C1V6A2_EUMVA|nr:28 kDa heat- and acid-stable phosphoprotein [Eumeta japonica]